MVVDANVFNAFFQMDIGRKHTLCGCPRKLMTGASATTPIFQDSGGLIEHEWQNVVDRDWFTAWLSASLQAGVVKYIDAPKVASLEKRLQKLGFPPSRDLVYVRVSSAVAANKNSCEFYTEDLDFYDPKKKGCNAVQRIKILKTSKGPVCKLLAKNNINVRCAPL